MKKLFDELGILELADSIEEDEFQNTTYVFTSSESRVQVHHSLNDNDLHLEIFVKGQKYPIIKAALLSCSDISAVNDERGGYIEVAGVPVVDGLLRHETNIVTSYRLRISPYVQFEQLNSKVPKIR